MSLYRDFTKPGGSPCSAAADFQAPEQPCGFPLLSCKVPLISLPRPWLPPFIFLCKSTFGGNGNPGQCARLLASRHRIPVDRASGFATQTTAGSSRTHPGKRTRAGHAVPCRRGLESCLRIRLQPPHTSPVWVTPDAWIVPHLLSSFLNFKGTFRFLTCTMGTSNGPWCTPHSASRSLTCDQAHFPAGAR